MSASVGQDGKKVSLGDAEKLLRVKLLELRYRKEREKLERADAAGAEKQEFAPSFMKLSAALGVARTTLYRLRDRPDAPIPREDGQYDIEEWRAFVENILGVGDDSHDEEMQRLKRENLRLTNETKRWELMRRQGSLLTMAEHLDEVRQIIEQVKWLVAAIPTRAALLTTDSGIRESISVLCEHVHAEFVAKITALEKRAATAERAADALDDGGKDNESDPA